MKPHFWHACLWAGWLATATAADITPGYTFSSGEANVTHTKLNNAAAGTINSTFYSGKSAAGANPTPGNHTFLGLDSVSGNFKRATLDVWVFDHEALLNSRVAKTTPSGGDLLLISDSAAGGAYKSIFISNALYAATAHTAPTNTDLLAIFNSVSGTLGVISLTNLFGWAAPLAVQAASTNYQLFTGTGGWLDFTNLTVTITPRSPTSRFLLRASLEMDVDVAAAHFRFVRNSTPIALGEDLGGLRPLATKTFGQDDTHSESMEWIDAPATASAVTYKIQWLSSGGWVHVNRGNSAADSTNNASAVSTLIVQEVRQ